MPTVTNSRIITQRRQPRVFVEVPPSPIIASTSKPSREASLLNADIKNTAPLRPNNPNVAAQSSGSLALSSSKRKAYPQSPYVEITSHRSKKPRVDPKPAYKVQISKKSTTALPSHNCHQCNQKRGPDALVFCNSGKANYIVKKKGKTCARKYCFICIKNRYPVVHKDLEELQGKNTDGNMLQFTCPTCNDACNCWKCRKLKGLEPLGKTAFLPSGLPIEDPAADSIPTQHRATTTSIPKRKALPKKIPPEVEWTPLPTTLSRSDAEARIQIREFVNRFSGLLDTPKTHLDELEYISGKGDDIDGLTPWVNDACTKSIVIGLLELLAEDYPKQESEAIIETVKEIRRNSPGSIAGRIWSAIQGLGGSAPNSGANMSVDGEHEEVHSRASASPEEFVFSLPNPLSAVGHSALHVTRRITSIQQGVDRSESTSRLEVFHTAQLVPVVAALTDLALETREVKSELDAGMNDLKEAIKAHRGACKAETERWDEEKKSLSASNSVNKKAEIASAREAHQNKLQYLEVAFKVGLHAYDHRFYPLGEDVDGRIYYALTPGAIEQESAIGLATKTPVEKDMKGKKPTKRSGTVGMDGDEMRDWAWMVCVWGKRPTVAADGKKNSEGRGDEDEEKDEREADKEKWWGFCDTDEIRKLAEWVEITAENKLQDIEDDEDDEKARMAEVCAGRREELAGSLNEYATMLEWRRKALGIEPGGGSGSGSAAPSAPTSVKGADSARLIGPIPPARFYG